MESPTSFYLSGGPGANYLVDGMTGITSSDGQPNPMGDASWANVLQAGTGYATTPLRDEAPIIGRGAVNGGAPMPWPAANGRTPPDLQHPASLCVERGWRNEVAIGRPGEIPEGWPRPPPGFPRPADGASSPMPPLTEWYKGSFRDALNLAREDVLASYPYTSSVPPPVPVVGDLAQSLRSTVAVEPPQGRLVGLSPGFSTLEGMDGMINNGLLDHGYIIQEASRRKQDIDRALNVQLGEMEAECQHRYSAIKQQAEHHTRLAEQQIESHKRNYINHITGQTQAQALQVTQRASEEKQRLGQEANMAIAQVVERNKAQVMHRQMLEAEGLHNETQRALVQQTQGLRQQIAAQMKRRAEEIDRDRKQAISAIYASNMAPGGA